MVHRQVEREQLLELREREIEEALDRQRTWWKKWKEPLWALFIATMIGAFAIVNGDYVVGISSFFLIITTNGFIEIMKRRFREEEEVEVEEEEEEVVSRNDTNRFVRNNPPLTIDEEDFYNYIGPGRVGNRMVVRNILHQATMILEREMGTLPNVREVERVVYDMALRALVAFETGAEVVIRSTEEERLSLHAASLTNIVAVREPEPDPTRFFFFLDMGWHSRFREIPCWTCKYAEEYELRLPGRGWEGKTIETGIVCTKELDPLIQEIIYDKIILTDGLGLNEDVEDWSECDDYVDSDEKVWWDKHLKEWAPIGDSDLRLRL
jgi:hypothetical protein